MTFVRLALAGLGYYRRTHAAVVLGVAAAVAVLAGSLLVGDSVRASLRSIAASRLGRTAVVVAAEQPFGDGLARRIGAAIPAPLAPLLSLTGLVRHESSSRRAGGIRVYGVDDRFFTFHGVAAPALGSSDAWLSADLAGELGAAEGDAVVIRVARPTDIPIDSLHGRRDEVGRSIRLTARGALAREQMGEFSLSPGQGPARAVFVPLTRLQRDLNIYGRVNTLLIGADAARTTEVSELRGTVNRLATADDLGLRIQPDSATGATVVESASGLLSDPIATRLTELATAQGRAVTPVLTWLANRMTVGNRTVPYSLVTAVGQPSGGYPVFAPLAAPRDNDTAPIVLNAWAMRDLGAKIGDALDLEYFRWADEGRLVTEHAVFRVAGVAPMAGLAVDRRLAPEYPGITTASRLGDWDPPFPIDLKLIRKQDEDYWDQYRTVPKAFIPIETGQSLWRTRHGQLTSLRISGTARLDLSELGSAGTIGVVAVRAQNLAASAGATDFGAYFSYFSFFLMAAALLLAALFFRLGIEQRLPQIGVLRATGFALADIRRLFLLEGAVVAIVGAAAGAVLAVAWAALMMFALGTWWVGAVGTTLLTLHVGVAPLTIGALAAAAAAMASIYITIRALNRSAPREQITGTLPASSVAARARTTWIMPISIVLAALLGGASIAGVLAPVGGFFGAGALVLVGGLAGFRTWLGHSRTRPAGLRSLASLGLRNAAWRPGRTLTAVGLVAAAVFLLVSVDSFRKTVGATGARTSGTGGFAIVGETQLPIAYDLGTPEGRADAGLSDGAPALAGIVIHPFRLRPGDDASCLNLYQPKQPRILGVPERFVGEARFRFARVTEDAGADERANPWILLGRRGTGGSIPAIVDQTSLQYVLHAAVGDTITIDADTSRPIDLHIVASLDDSLLQGEILIGERAFQEAFPAIAGYRVFLAEITASTPERLDAASQELEAALEPFGFDAQPAAAKLEAFHRVENTYLSTFQALGGLGLVLGCLGLVAIIARNVLERRRELALLGAAGFTGADLQRLVIIEHLALVGVGLSIGLVAAAVAVAPVAISRSGTAPWHALVWLVPVAGAGLAAAYGATRSLRRMPLVASLRSE